MKLRQTRRYGPVWDDNPEIEAERCKTELPVSVEKEENKIITGDYAPFNVSSKETIITQFLY